MAWTYNDWRSQSGQTAQRTRLILHIEEVEDQLSANLTADGRSRDVTPLNDYLARLQSKLDEFDKALGLGPYTRTNPISLADLR